MRDSAEALRVALERIRTGVQQGRYEATVRVCSDLIKLSYQLECKPELFIGEVLESTCLQVGNALQAYVVPEDVKNDLQERIGSHMDRLLTAYVAHADVHGVLMDIRYDATVFQFETWAKRDRAQPLPRTIR